MTTDELPIGERVAKCAELIAGLEAGLADLDRQAGEARQTRAQVALEAREGNGPAKRLLADATRRTVEIATERENAELALATARERLAGLEAAREAEAKDDERRRILNLCEARLEQAARIDAALAAAAAAARTWQQLGGLLHGFRRKRWREQLEDQDYAGLDAKASLMRALPPELLQAAGLQTGYFAADWRPLVSLDAAGWTKEWLERAAPGGEQPGRSEAEAA